MNELSLFTGAGGGVLGSILLGWRVIGYVEKDDYCQKVIAQRIKDGFLDDAPIFGDIRTFISEGYAASYTGVVDVLTAGFPCQPFSVAGQRKGADDERNLWPDTIRAIRIVRPRYVLLENVPGLLAANRKTLYTGLLRDGPSAGVGQWHDIANLETVQITLPAYVGRVFGDLAESGYSLPWKGISAAELGAPHRRDRLWIVADASSQRRQQERGGPLGDESLDEGWPTVSDNEPQGSSQDVADTTGEGGWGLHLRPGRSLEAPIEPPGCSEDLADAEMWGRDAGTTQEPREHQGRGSQKSPRGCGGSGEIPHTPGPGLEERDGVQPGRPGAYSATEAYQWWAVEPDVGRVADGVASRVDRLKALGNGQVPSVVRAAWRVLKGE